MPRALITGITGQDGSYLAEWLLERGAEVHGVVRSTGPVNDEWLGTIRDRISLHRADLTDPQAIAQLVEQIDPDEVYNLASISFVPRSWEEPAATGNVVGMGVVHWLEALRRLRPEARFCQASSSEIFGRPKESPQTEGTPLAPVNPYGAAKAYAHWMVGQYRIRYGMHASSAILYNHESPRRGIHFVTRKITDAAARIRLGLTDRVALGDLTARRDWGFAGDFVRALWLMDQHDRPDDYVIATGRTHTVQDLVEYAFGCVGLDWRAHVEVDPALVRPPEMSVLCGDPNHARTTLGWEPTVDLRTVIERMVEADLQRYRSQGVTHGE